MRTYDLTKFYNTGLVLLAILCISFSSYMLLGLDRPEQDLSLPLIGKVFQSQNDVRRKNSDQLYWVSVKQDNAVYGADSIFTNESSLAKVRLDNESEVLIDELSMVKFKGKNEIDFEQGSLTLNLKAKAKALNIRIGNSRIKVSANTDSELKLVKRFKENKIQVNKGSVSLSMGEILEKTADSEKVDLSEGESVIVKPKKLSIRDENIKLVSPQGTVFKKRGERVYFNYEAEASVEKIWVERVGTRFELDPNESLNLKAGFYKWGVQLKEESRSDKYASFTLIKKIDTPKIEVGGGASTLNSQEYPFAVSFENLAKNKVWLEILNSKKKAVFADYMKTQTSQISFSEPGEYQWRGKILDEFEISKFTPWSKLVLTNEEVFTVVNRIELVKPNSRVNFTWEAAGSVDFELSKDRDFKNILETRKTSNSGVSINIKEPGEYFWQIKSQRPIKIRKVLIVPIPAPVRAPKVKAIKKIIESSSVWEKIMNIIFPQAHAAEIETTVEWEKISTAKDYEIQIFRDKQSSQPIFETKTSEPKILWRTVEAGVYYYRVRYRDFWNRYSPYSPKTTLEIVKKTSSKNQISQDLWQTKSRLRKMAFLYSAADWNQTEGNIEIDGLSTTGHALKFYLNKIGPLNSDMMFNYSSQYGKVFDSQSFVFRQTELMLLREWRELNLGAVLGLKQTSGYEVNNDKAEQFINYLNWSLGVYIDLPINLGKFVEMKPHFVYLLGDFQQTRFGLSVEYLRKNGLSPYLLGQFLNSRSDGKSDSVISRASQLQLGLKSDF